MARAERSPVRFLLWAPGRDAAAWALSVCCVALLAPPPSSSDGAPHIRTTCVDGSSETPFLDLHCPGDSLIRVRELVYIADGSPKDRSRCSLADGDCYRVDASRAHGCNGKRSCSVALARARFYGHELAECGRARATRFQATYACVNVTRLEDMCSLPQRRFPRLEAREGFIASYGYPDPYASGLNCSFTLLGGRVTLRAESVLLEDRDDCLITRDLLGGRSWCGGGTGGHAALENQDFVSSGSGNFLRVTFVTSSRQATRGGVWLHYTETPLDKTHDSEEEDGQATTHDHGRTSVTAATVAQLLPGQMSVVEAVDRTTYDPKYGRADVESRFAASKRPNVEVDQPGDVSSGAAEDAQEALGGEEDDQDSEDDETENYDDEDDIGDGTADDDASHPSGPVETSDDSTLEEDNDATPAEDKDAAPAELDGGSAAAKVEAPVTTAEIGVDEASSADKAKVATGALLVYNISANARAGDPENLSATLATTFGSISIVLLVIINAYVVRRTWASSRRKKASVAQKRPLSKRLYGNCYVAPSCAQAEAQA